MNELISLVEMISNTSISSLKNILPNKDGWEDSAARLIRQIPDKQLYDSPIGTDRHSYVRRRFGHISVNPHLPHNTDTLINVYECADHDDIKVGSEYINKDKDILKLFVWDLIMRSREARNLVLDKNKEIDATDRYNWAIRRLHLLLFGDRGCGKTFVLNHILSRFSNEFDIEKVIWVRCDLVESFEGDVKSDFNYDLRHQILAQLTKIVLRYYQPGSFHYKGKPKPLDAVSYLLKYAKDEARDQETQNRWIDSIQTMKGSFGTKESDPAITPELVPKHLAEALFRFVISSEYSIIGVLDGLDRLEADSYHKRRFARLFDAAVELTNTKGTCGMVLVSVTRTNTLNLLHRLSKSTNPYSPGESDIKQVYPVDFERVFNKRIEYLITHVPQVAKTTGWSVDDWPHHLPSFKEFLGEAHEKPLLRALVDLLGSNRRAQMQVVQLMYDQFLKHIEPRHYLLTETIALAGRRYPPRSYRYSLTPKGNWRRDFIRPPGFDNHFLPSIFHFPYIDWDSHMGHEPKIPCPEGALWGIRLLQIISASDRMWDRLYGYWDPINSKELSDMLYMCFDYPRDQTMDLIQDFQEFQFIGSTNKDFPVLTNIQRSELHLMPKGLFILRYYLYDIAYLNLCAMRIPLAGTGLNNEKSYFLSTCPDVIANPTDQWGLNVSEILMKWVATKAINSSALCRYITKINEMQYQRYNERIVTLDARWRRILSEAETGYPEDIKGMFNFVSHLKKEVQSQNRAMLMSLNNQDSRIIPEVKQIISAWWTQWESM